MILLTQVLELESGTIVVTFVVDILCILCIGVHFSTFTYFGNVFLLNSEQQLDENTNRYDLCNDIVTRTTSK